MSPVDRSNDAAASGALVICFILYSASYILVFLSFFLFNLHIDVHRAHVCGVRTKKLFASLNEGLEARTYKSPRTDWSSVRTRSTNRACLMHDHSHTGTTETENQINLSMNRSCAAHILHLRVHSLHHMTERSAIRSCKTKKLTTPGCMQIDPGAFLATRTFNGMPKVT